MLHLRNDRDPFVTMTLCGIDLLHAGYAAQASIATDEPHLSPANGSGDIRCPDCWRIWRRWREARQINESIRTSESLPDATWD